MERLVYNDKEYVQLKGYEDMYCHHLCDEFNHNCDECIMTKVLKLTADYQATDLMPEQIHKIIEKNKTLAKENRKLKKEMLKMMNYSWYSDLQIKDEENIEGEVNVYDVMLNQEEKDIKRTLSNLDKYIK